MLRLTCGIKALLALVWMTCIFYSVLCHAWVMPLSWLQTSSQRDTGSVSVISPVQESQLFGANTKGLLYLDLSFFCLEGTFINYDNTLQTMNLPALTSLACPVTGLVQRESHHFRCVIKSTRLSASTPRGWLQRLLRKIITHKVGLN